MCKQIMMIKDGKSYNLGNVTDRSFNGAKFISLGENCVIEEIEEIEVIGNVVNVECVTGRGKVVRADIVEIIANVDSSCNGKLIATDAPIAVCSKCNSKMKIARRNERSVV